MDGHPRGRAQPDQGGARDILTFDIERLSRYSIPPALLEAHYKELAPLQHINKLKPDWEAYSHMQQLGDLLFVTARITTRPCHMVGYMVLVVRPHLHYGDVLVAIDDIHYLAPEYRGAGWGKKLIEFAEQAAANMGAKIFSVRCKAKSNHGYIFESLGYELTDLVYIKDLTNVG
jgi:GNAT superfamily N-acetyltransferase